MPTPTSEIADLCAPFKPGNGAEVVDAMTMAVAVGDDVAIRMLAAFGRIALPTWRRPRARKPTELRSLWLWLWSGYLGGPDDPIFLDELAKRAGVTIRAATTRWHALVTSGLLFPDGTLHPDATVLVAGHVASRLPKPPPEPKVELPRRTQRTPR